MPDVAARIDGAHLACIGGGFDAVEDPFGGRDLVGTHHQQLVVGVEDAVAGEDRQQGVAGEEGTGEPDQVEDGLVGGIGPPAGELEGVGHLAARSLGAGGLVNMGGARGVGVVLGQRPVADHEQLHIFVEPRIGPETLALVAVDLVEGLADVDAAPLEFHLHHGQAVHQDGDVVAVGSRAGVGGVLVDHLQAVVVDVALVEQVDVLGGAVVTVQQLDVVVLDATGLLHDAVVVACDRLGEEAGPLVVGEGELVERLELLAQVGDEIIRAVDGQVLVGLLLQQLDESRFEGGLALIALVVGGLGDIFGNDSAPLADRNGCVVRGSG